MDPFFSWIHSSVDIEVVSFFKKAFIYFESGGERRCVAGRAEGGGKQTPVSADPDGGGRGAGSHHPEIMT